MENVKARPATAGEVAIYLPYYPASRRQALGPALGLYKAGMLSGQRRVEGGANIPFVATWDIKSLPSDTTVCRIRFEDGNQFIDYELALANTEFLGFLMEMLNLSGDGTLDFSSQFYRRLLGYNS